MTAGASLDMRVFLFTDLEASTRLWQDHPTTMPAALARHDAILREAVEQSGGQVVKTTGDGLMAVFETVADGVRACIAAQERLRDEPWGDTGPLRVRMGMHAGNAEYRAGDYYGTPVNRAARIMAAAHGGQVLLSALAADLVRGRLPDGVELRDMGEHGLKDLSRPERLFQLVHPGLPDDFPPLLTLRRWPNNLPTQASEFYGRQEQLEAICQLLEAPGVRLVTLLGPGGIGKTRLSLQVGADRIEHFADGVFFVDLASVTEPEGVFEAIVQATGLTSTSDDRPIEVLRQQLRDRQMLLILDNFEQVVAAASGVVDLIQHAPGLKMLVTSREALRVRGEHLVPVPPLSLPERGPLPELEVIAGYEAVRLFVERAREVQPGFELTEQNAPAIVDICARLDGLPLAIELAASRLRLFSPDELRERLRTRLELLRGGPRDLPARQQTLRDTIAWSYDLLDSDERATFRLLSVFSPTRVAAVEEVASQLEPLQNIDVIDRLTSLVDKSLVRSIGLNGRQQLSMLETIREYAAERLAEEPDLDVAVRRAHAGYFADFAQRRYLQMREGERASALDELGLELGNLTKSWQYWVASGDLEQLHRLLDALWALYEARGWYHAAVDLANDLLHVLSMVPETTDRAQEEITLRISLARGLMALRGYTEEVEESYARILALSAQIGELPQQYPVLRSIASFYLYRGEFDKTEAIGRRILDLGEQQDDAALRADGHLLTGAGLAFQGDVPAGLEHLERTISLFDPRQGSARFRFGANPGLVAHTTSALLLWLTGFPDRAVQRGMQAESLARQMDHPYSLAYILFHAGVLNLWRGELALVHERAQLTLEVAERHDYHIWTALALLLQGVAMTGMGQPVDGLARIDQSTAMYQRMRTPPVFWPLVLYIRARALAQSGRPEEGIVLIDEAVGMTGQEFLFPEFSVLKGDMLLKMQGPESAEPPLHSAFDVGARLGLRMSQLRAATRLARFDEGSRAGSNGQQMLRDIYQTFTEGFGERDLIEARSLITASTEEVV